MIKPQWDKYTQSMAELADMIDDFSEGVTDNRTAKAFKKITDKWAHIVHQHNEIDRLVDPIAAIEVKMPFEGSEFSKMWILYKESLIEKHGEYLVSRQEQNRLNRLKRMADGNVTRAIIMLEFFMDNGYKGIFKPSEKQLTGDEPSKTEDMQQSLDLTKKPVI